jgi:hypothetical protein
VSQAPDLVATLFEADTAERSRVLGELDPGRLDALVAQLGRRREPAAAEILLLVEQVVDDRALKKAARRELHRLRSMGVPVPAAESVSAAPASRPATADVSATAVVPVSQAWATDIDPVGTRALWLLAERPMGGAWFAAVLLNDMRGVPDLSLVESTRKRFQRELDNSRRSQGIWVSLPGPYALALVREAVDVGRAHDASPPARYHAFRDAFGEAGGPPERALVYETISPVEVNFNPDWLGESASLVTEPEMAGWSVTLPTDLASRALDVARGPASGLLVPGHSPEQQAMTLFGEAVAQGFDPDVRRAIRRRLEETAFIFVETDRLTAARRAVAAARALADDSIPLERQPFARLLVGAGLGRLISTEIVGGRRASEVLLDVLERASQQSGSAAVETRPSGLILPR